MQAGCLAKECPTLNRDEIISLLQNAASCNAAMELFESCANGASGDTEFGDIVVSNCEKSFLPKLTSHEKRVYAHRQKQCSEKYKNKEGSMYVSCAAFCRAKVAKSYAK